MATMRLLDRPLPLPSTKTTGTMPESFRNGRVWNGWRPPCGSWGSAADYLFRTVEALRGHGIRDMALEETGKLVEAALLLSIWPQAA